MNIIKPSKNRQIRIEEIITSRFNINFLQVENVSYKHINHNGDDGSGETHYSIIIFSSDFSNNTRVQNHRKVMNLLKIEFQNGLHAIEISIKST